MEPRHCWGGKYAAWATGKSRQPVGGIRGTDHNICRSGGSPPHGIKFGRSTGTAGPGPLEVRAREVGGR